jgi:hypothetical protein
LTRNDASAFAYDVSIALSKDAGETWSDEFAPHFDGTPTEHGFVSLFPSGGGVGALWLDGRNMLTDNAGTTLRSALFTATSSLAAEHLIDALVCDCCRTDVAIGPQGPIAVYRDRTADEVRDINVAQFVNGAWLPPRRVAIDDWNVSGCPINGPAIDAQGVHVAVAWFTGAHDKPRVRLARSVDGAKNFAAAIDISEIRPMGRVDVIAYADGGAVVSWLRRSTPSMAELCVREVAANGSIGPVHPIAQISTARPAGFPQLRRHGEGLVLAWAEPIADRFEVRTVRLTMRQL